LQASDALGNRSLPQTEAELLKDGTVLPNRAADNLTLPEDAEMNRQNQATRKKIAEQLMARRKLAAQTARRYAYAN